MFCTMKLYGVSGLTSVGRKPGRKGGSRSQCKKSRINSSSCLELKIFAEVVCPEERNTDAAVLACKGHVYESRRGVTTRKMKKKGEALLAT
jgi:hypothetical protein